jgi:hypothetical protein
MGTSTFNPLMTSNPGGSPVSFPSTPNAQNPYMPAVPGGPPSSPTNANPYAAGGFPAYGFSGTSGSSLPTIGSPVTSSGTPGYGTTGGPLGLGEGLTGGMQTLQKGLDKIYGSGIGNALTQFLASGAGYNPQILQQLFAQLQPQFAGQQQNLLQNFSAGGNRFSSGAQIGMADLMGQQSLTEGSMASQLYEQAVQNYMSVLTGAGAATAAHPQPSIWDTISSALGLGSTVAGGASALISAVNPGADTGILDAIAGM